MTRLLGILIGGVALVVAIIIGISAIGGYMERRVHGSPLQPMQTLLLADGTRVRVYDLAITGQPCLLASTDTGLALSCDWYGQDDRYVAGAGMRRSDDK